jgi:hypothetical protein
MRKYINRLIIGTSILMICLLLGITTANARQYMGAGSGPKPKSTTMKVAAGCDPPRSQIDMDINNVRTKLFNGGDMWWDLFGNGNAYYEIPKVKNAGDRSVHSSFASALWFGGVDDGGQLKTAGQTYRQIGLDFWAGPLDTTNAEIDKDDCTLWDKHFPVLQKEITEFRNGEPASESIANWPGNGDAGRGETQYLAPFHDADQDGYYFPANGDYPTLDPRVLGAKPDQMIWWVYNDKGNTHTAYPGGEPIGLEIQATAFAFSTSNEIDNMTFYKYRVANRASSPLYDTYFGVFTDSDLGNASDDYVGCNMALVDPDGAGPLGAKRRSFGYTYNADDNDEDGGSLGYGLIPPVFGIDYFRGPKDENGDELPMSTFMLFTNKRQAGINSDPRDATELYRYLRGFWADGQPLTYGTPSGRGGTDPCKYAFPGVTDPDGRPLWDETQSPGDRRMVQSSGPFTLQPGAVNEVIIGAVWARASSGNNLSSIASAIIADDKAQILFDNDFKLANGPDPVDLVIIPGDNRATLTLQNTDACEKYDENELDNEDLGLYNYRFQGYRIFQLKDGTVSASQLDDINNAIEIAQVDITDQTSTIINKYFDPLVQNTQAKIMVEGANKGIKHIFEVTNDAFSSSFDSRLVNGKTYYFIVIPYGFSSTATSSKYLPSRTSTEVVSVTVGKQVINGLINGKFESTMPFTRTDGAGNGGQFLELTPESEAAIVANTSGIPVTYQNGFGPVYVKVFDPTKIQKRNYALKFTADMKSYELRDADTDSLLMISDTTYDAVNTLTPNEQIAEERIFKTLPNGTRVLERRTSLGFAIVVDNTKGKPGQPGAILNENNSFLGASQTFADETKPWYTGYDGRVPFSSGALGWTLSEDSNDPENAYYGILGGTWAPYKLTRAVLGGAEFLKSSPLFDPASRNAANSKFDSIGSYDIVFTSDETKWSDCIVLEAGLGSLSETNTEGGQKRFNLRKKDIGYGIGRSRFPGYAINLETGERVNIFFSEASNLTADNGNDMLWNPSSNTDYFNKGGRHYIYVTRRKYDGCNQIHSILSANIDNPTNAQKYSVFGMVDWVNVPLLKAGQTLLSTDVKVKLRVSKPYYVNRSTGANNGFPAYNFNDKDVLQNATNDAEVNKKLALELINIVPNPYYAYSSYEPNRNDFRVRITNLPAQATVTIYTTNGILVRRFTKSDPLQTFVEWDLRNANRIPIASGVYLIHVNCPGVGEKTLKWMGVMRPVDFTNF